MTTIRRFALRLLAFFRINRAEDELAREICAHLQLLEDGFVARGMSRDDARLAARRSFGGVEQAKEHQRDARGFRWLDDSRIDFKLGARMLVKYPGLSVIGGTGLAVATAFGAAFFSFFYSYIYATPPGADGHRIVALENWDTRVNNEMRQSAADFVAWRDGMQTVQEIGAFRTVGRNLIVPGGAPEPVRVSEITAAGFNILHVQPALGRGLHDSDEASGARPVLVISHEAWRTRFAGDASVIGREVHLGAVGHMVVGVMPPGFAFPVNDDYWTPLQIARGQFAPKQGPSIFIFGRLRPGVSVAQAQAELTTLGERMAAVSPATHQQVRPRVLPYAHPILDIQGTTTWEFALMQSMVSLLLIVVAINVGILIYARTATRQGEIAVRTALGASRRRIVGQLFIEALVLCGVAAAAGLLLAGFGLSQGHAIMQAETGSLPSWIDASIPAPAYGYVALLTIAAALLAGAAPALQATGRRMQSTLKETTVGSGLRLGRTWTALVVAQVALAVLGLPMAVSAFWGEIAYSTTSTTFEMAPYVAARLAAEQEGPRGMNPAQHRLELGVRMSKLRGDFASRLEAEPAVDDVTLALGVPGDEPVGRIEIEQMATPSAGAPRIAFNRVAVDFFDAFEVRLIAGRLLTAGDAVSEVSPIVVNQSFARKVLNFDEPIGRRIRYLGDDDSARGEVGSGRWHEIVGVVSDMTVNRLDPDFVEPVAFHPLPASTALPVATLVRVRGHDAADFTDRLRAIGAELDPTVRLTLIPFVELQRQQTLALRLMLLALGLIVSAVLLLSAAGVSAMMSFTVSQRRKEIGIRAAMGADAAQLLRGIFTRAATQLGAGVAVGAAAALGLDAASGGEMLGAAGRMCLPVVAVMMVIVGLVAAIGPARRGLRVQPTEALRAE